MRDVTIAVVVDCGFDHHRAVPASLRTEWWDTNGFGKHRQQLERAVVWTADYRWISILSQHFTSENAISYAQGHGLVVIDGSRDDL